MGTDDKPKRHVVSLGGKPYSQLTEREKHLIAHRLATLIRADIEADRAAESETGSDET